MHETEDKFRINVMKTYQCFSWKLAIIQTESLQNNSTNSILKKAVFTEKVKNLRKLRENIESIEIQFESVKETFSWKFLIISQIVYVTKPADSTNNIAYGVNIKE